ncbi:MAG: class I tRNA ligase family protein, partial [Hyphomicrobiales bacterium]
VRRMMLLSLEAVDINLDHFMRAYESEAFAASATHYLNAVSADVERRPAPVHHCPACGKWGYEAFGRGKCNWCGSSSDASQCEHCARKPIAELMTDMTCIACGSPMELVDVDCHVWTLGRHYPAVAKAHAGQPIRQCLADFLKDSLADTSDNWIITRPGDAGLSLAASDGLPLHTWFMGLSGYRAAVVEYLAAHPERGSFADWWGPETKLVHFLGYDCSFSHAVAYAVEQISDPAGPPVGLFLTNRFLKLNGEDFSTSRGIAVWIKDMTGQYPSDAIRLYTAAFSPETEVKNFEMGHFRDWLAGVYKPMSLAARQARPNAKADRSAFAASPALAKWRRHADLGEFSITGMAEAVLAFPAEIDAAPEEARAAGWAIFSEIAAPLCPQMTRHLQGAQVS